MFTDTTLKLTVPFMIPFLFALNESVCNGKIYFYQKADYRDYLFDRVSISGCNEVSSTLSNLVVSIKTDICLMVYTGSDCLVGRFLGFSFRIDPPGYADLYNYFRTTPEESNGVRSFQACNETDGGSSLDVDTYTFYEPAAMEWSHHPLFKVYGLSPPQEIDHESYRGVCSCQNLHHRSRKTYLSIHNHGNELMTFTEEDCSGTSRFIPPGYSKQSRDLEGIKSFSAYQDSPYFRHCLKLFSNVYKFEFLEPLHANQAAIQENVEFAAKTTFINDGNAVLTQEYSVTKTVRESVEVEIAASLSNMHHVGVEASVEMEASASIPFIAETKFKVGLKTSYDYERTSTESRSEKKTIETTSEVTRKQTIEVQPCTEYTISGTMTRVKNKQIDYRAHVKITGWLGNERLTAEKIKKYLDQGLEYVKDLNGFTVVAIARGTMKAEYGMDAVLSGTGKPIPGCVTHETVTEPPQIPSENVRSVIIVTEQPQITSENVQSVIIVTEQPQITSDNVTAISSSSTTSACKIVVVTLFVFSAIL